MAKKNFPKTNYLTSAALALSTLAAISANDAEAQGLRAQQPKADKINNQEINTGLILGTKVGIHNTNTVGAENQYLEIGFQQTTEGVGIGGTIAFPFKNRDLGTTITETRLPRYQGPNQYTKVINEVVGSTNQKTFFKGRLAFNQENSSFFLTSGFVEDKYTNEITRITHREYTNQDGTITATPTIMGPTNRITNSTNYFIGGLGFERKFGPIDLYVDVTRTFGMQKNETYAGIGFKWDFKITKRQNR